MKSGKYGIKINVYAKQDVRVSPVESANAKYFTFDVETGTITGYADDGPKDLVIPRTSQVRRYLCRGRLWATLMFFFNSKGRLASPLLCYLI